MASRSASPMESVEACADDAGVVEHQNVPGTEIVRQVAELPVLGEGFGPVDDHEARAVARGSGRLRDEFRR